jgi:hypothetical protein
MITTFSAIISTMQHTCSILWNMIPLISLWSRSADLDWSAVKQQLLTTRARHRHTHTTPVDKKRSSEKRRQTAGNEGHCQTKPNLRVPKQYTTSNPQWPNSAYQCPLFWLLKLAGELLLNLATGRLNQVGFLSIRAYDSDSLHALSLILLLVRFCENELKTF